MARIRPQDDRSSQAFRWGLVVHCCVQAQSEKLADEVHQLQEAVAVANTDLQLAEAHATEMQSRCAGFHHC